MKKREYIRKGFLHNLGILLGSLFVFLLATEGALRLLYPKALHVHKRFPQGMYCKPDPLFGWIGLPNVSAVLSPPTAAKDMEDMRVSMNEEGFLDDSHLVSRSPGVNSLLFLGDSFTIGLGIPRTERFTDLIKNDIQPSWAVMNMGMWGYSTGQELLVLEEEGLKYAPDVVVLCMFLDDFFCTNLFSVNDGMYIKPRFSLAANGELKLGNVPVPNNHGKSALVNLVLTRFYKLRNRLGTGAEFSRQGWISVYDTKYFAQNGYELTLRLVAEIYALAKTRGIDFLLVLIPDKDQINAQQITAQGAGYCGIPPHRFDLHLPQKVVKPFCEKMGIPVLDLLPAFKGYEGQEALFFENDLHWTRAGHRLAAEQVLKRLRELGYL
jgi:lysophospholipase L1-like esterase